MLDIRGSFPFIINDEVLINNLNYKTMVHNLPQVIKVETPERVKSYRWDENIKQLDSHVAVLDLDSIDKMKNVSFSNHPAIGDVFVLHPYAANKYINILEIDNIKNSKFYAYSEIAQQLGALSYEIELAKKITEKATISVDGNIVVKPYGDLSAGIQNEKKFEEEFGFKMKSELNGVKVISNQSFEKAKELVCKYNLESDDMINSLINKRDPSNENLYNSENIQCKLSKEINSALNIAFSLSLLSVFEIDTKIKKTLENREDIVLNIKFVFPGN